MPRNQKKHHSRSRGDAERIIRIPFRVTGQTNFSASATTTTVGTINLTASSLGPRVTAIAPNYEWFRISRMKVSGYTSYGGVTYDTSGVTKVGVVIGEFAIAFDPEASADTTAPSTFTSMCQFDHYVSGGMYAREQFHLQGKDMFGSTGVKWYHTTATGSPPAETLSAGVVYLATYNQTSTGSPCYANVYLEGIVEFKGAVAPTLSYEQKSSQEFPSWIPSFSNTTVLPYIPGGQPSGPPSVGDDTNDEYEFVRVKKSQLRAAPS